MNEPQASIRREWLQAAAERELLDFTRPMVGRAVDVITALMERWDREVEACRPLPPPPPYPFGVWDPNQGPTQVPVSLDLDIEEHPASPWGEDG